MFAATVLYLLAINLGAFGAFWADKRAAEQGLWRISETTLLRLALVGGTLGAIAGQQFLRHKTRKEPFRSRLWLIAGAQGVALALIAPQLAR